MPCADLAAQCSQPHLQSPGAQNGETGTICHGPQTFLSGDLEAMPLQKSPEFFTP